MKYIPFPYPALATAIMIAVLATGFIVMWTRRNLGREIFKSSCGHKDILRAV
jgi:hypothetical protein